MSERKRSSREINSPEDEGVPKAVRRLGGYPPLISSKKENWRGNINYYLAGLPDAVDALYTKYNTPLHENGYGSKHAFGDVQMSITEGMEKVRRMNDVDQKRKLTKYRSGIQRLYE